MYSYPCACSYLVFICSLPFMWVFFFAYDFLFPLQTCMKFALQQQYQRDCAFTLLFSILFLIKKPNPRVLQSMNLLSNYCLKCFLLFLSTVLLCALTISNDSTALYHHSISEFFSVSIQNHKSKNNEQMSWAYLI